MYKSIYSQFKIRYSINNSFNRAKINLVKVLNDMCESILKKQKIHLGASKNMPLELFMFQQHLVENKPR